MRETSCIHISYNSVVKNKASIDIGFTNAQLNANQIHRSTVQQTGQKMDISRDQNKWWDLGHWESCLDLFIYSCTQQIFIECLLWKGIPLDPC